LAFPFDISSRHEPPAFCVVVAHGLNVRPEAMKEIVALLLSMRAQVFLLRLSGHGSTSTNLQEIGQDVWKDEFFDTVSEAQTSARNYDIPLHFVGYSLGCLVCEYAMASSASALFDKKIFLAPATHLRRRSRLLSFFSFLPDNFTIPSLTPKDIRARQRLPLKFYRNMFEMERYIHSSDFHDATPTLIVIDPEDELISVGAIRRSSQNFSHQTIEILNYASPGTSTFHHLIINEHSCGAKNWKRMTTKIQTFLEVNG
jgi:esterase/lipase